MIFAWIETVLLITIILTALGYLIYLWRVECNKKALDSNTPMWDAGKITVIHRVDRWHWLPFKRISSSTGRTLYWSWLFWLWYRQNY